MIAYVVLGLIWLSSISVAVTIGRMVQSSVVAYPLAAVSSFAVFSVLVILVASVPALALMLEPVQFPMLPVSN